MAPVTVGQSWQNLNLICNKSKYIQIPNFNSISEKAAEKNPENWILVRGNNSCKSSDETKLDLYNVMTNSLTKFQVNISKDSREN